MQRGTQKRVPSNARKKSKVLYENKYFFLSYQTYECCSNLATGKLSGTLCGIKGSLVTHFPLFLDLHFFYFLRGKKRRLRFQINWAGMRRNIRPFSRFSVMGFRRKNLQSLDFSFLHLRVGKNAAAVNKRGIKLKNARTY